MSVSEGSHRRGDRVKSDTQWERRSPFRGLAPRGGLFALGHFALQSGAKHFKRFGVVVRAAFACLDLAVQPLTGRSTRELRQESDNSRSDAPPL